MKKIILASVLVSIIGALATAQNETKLANVKKIYIGDLGKEDGADLVREKIRLRLLKSERFTVVETPEAADAILTGVAGVERREYSSVSTNPSTGAVSGSGGTSYAGLGILRLVDVKSQETVWTFEYKRGFGFGSASSRVANKTVEQLLKNATASDKKDDSSKKQKEAKKAAAPNQ